MKKIKINGVDYKVSNNYPVEPYDMVLVSKPAPIIKSDRELLEEILSVLKDIKVKTGA